MKRTSWICILMLGLVFTWSMACAEDFYVIPVKRCDYAMLAPFEMIVDGQLQGGASTSSPVPAGQRLVITDLLISGAEAASALKVYRVPKGAGEYDCPGGGSTPVTPGLNLPSTGGTISHSFVSGIVFQEGQRVCLIHDLDPTGAAGNWLLRGYFTNP